MMLELEEAYGMFDVDDRVKCIIVTGTGKIFCAGADLIDGFKGGLEPINEHRDGYVRPSCFPILLFTEIELRLELELYCKN